MGLVLVNIIERTVYMRLLDPSATVRFDFDCGQDWVKILAKRAFTRVSSAKLPKLGKFKNSFIKLHQKFYRNDKYCSQLLRNVTGTR